MSRTVFSEPLDERGRADVERAWRAVQPALAKMRRKYPRLDIDGVAALHLCRYLRRHDGRLEAFAQRIVERAPGQAARALEPMQALTSEPPDHRTDGAADVGARSLLAGLRRTEADVLWMWAVEGLSCGEIAERTGMSPFGARMALKRARTTLKRRLGSVS